MRPDRSPGAGVSHLAGVDGLDPAAFVKLIRSFPSLRGLYTAFPSLSSPGSSGRWLRRASGGFSTRPWTRRSLAKRPR